MGKKIRTGILDMLPLTYTVDPQVGCSVDNWIYKFKSEKQDRIVNINM